MLENHYFSLKSAFMKSCVRELEVCIQSNRIDIPRITLETEVSQNVVWDFNNFMQIKLPRELPLIGDYENHHREFASLSKNLRLDSL